MFEVAGSVITEAGFACPESCYRCTADVGLLTECFQQSLLAALVGWEQRKQSMVSSGSK